MGPPCFSENCRLVQGSKTADTIITSEQRTERLRVSRLRRFVPVTAQTSAALRGGTRVVPQR